MEGFLEANRVVEASLAKLGQIHKSGELPLRKTLLISKALNLAQNAATSAHYSLLHNSSLTAAPTSRSSSKLLASISKQVEDSSVNESATTNGDSRLAKPPSVRLPSSIVSCSTLAKPEEEPMETEMDCESVTNSVISELFSDSEPAAADEAEMAPAPSAGNAGEAARPKTTNSWLEVSWNLEVNCTRNSSSSRWPWEPQTTLPPSHPSCPVSPGKRPHSEAFPFEENLVFMDSVEDPKRFKPTPPHGYSLESIPGFCGYLSPRNLQSAPLITYMFGKGFAEPSDPGSSGWPPQFDAGKSSTDNHFEAAVSTSPVKFSPILAF